jgi:hypothetical protein
LPCFAINNYINKGLYICIILKYHNTKKGCKKVIHIYKPLTITHIYKKNGRGGDKTKRKITKRDREIWRKNALKGTKKWDNMSHPKRVKKIHRPTHSWGFSGKSPNTRPRKYKRKI